MRQGIDTLYGMPGWLVGLLFLGLMVMACETGYALGLRSRAAEKTKAMVPTVAASILALLGLLLGFTMSMSVSRYDTRRRLVVEEANALMAAYQRAQALPAPENTEIQQLLRQYVDNRLRVSENALDPQILQPGKDEDARRQGELWSHAAALAQRNPQSVPAGLLLESLNNAFSLENSRWIGFVAHLPEGVIYVNALMGLVAALMVGYEFGITGQRHPLAETLLILSIMMVLTLIVEMDHPHSGVIRVSQQPLIDLQRRLAAPGH
jgi:apolipoprotein N-acyltransferase